jgi:CelD/BcsL family acetyltransferase involved in cellulose biosynthesis
MDNITIEKLTDNRNNEWDSFVNRSPQGTLFSTFTWAEILEKVFGLEHEVLAAVQNGKIISGIMIFYKKKFGINIITHAPLTIYNGILFDEPSAGEKSQKLTGHELELSEYLLKRLEREFKFINFSTSLNIHDARPYIWRDWKVKPQYTYILKLGDHQSILDNFSSSLRRKIKHCESESFKISAEGSITKLIELQEESYAKSGIKPVLTAALFEKLITTVKEKKLADVYSISLGDDIHSMRAVLKWNNNIYDWIAGSAASFRNSNATHFLLWNMLRNFSNNNYLYFDFMGANTKNIIDFKRSFGGELKEYYDITYYSSSFLQSMLFIDNILKRSSREQD